MQNVIRQGLVVMEMIKFQHTVFALPFAIASMLIAANGWPSLPIIFWVLLACVFARTAAMSFNRWADRDIDKRNPRTATRAIPAGQLQVGLVLVIALVSAAGFIFCAAMLNRLALMLSPVALVILFGYSYAKRFTSSAHFILGMALALAPVGAWVAVRQEIGLPAVLLGFGVLLWTAGFDLIYACQDTEVDKCEGLFSIPAKIGSVSAVRLAAGLHVLSILCFIATGFAAELGYAYFAGVGAAAILLAAEHWVVDVNDMRRINIAFFTINSWVGMTILAGTAADILAFS